MARDTVAEKQALDLFSEENVEENVRIPADVRDLESFRRWAHSEDFPERGRISYLGGEIDIDMSPEEIESHNKVKRDVGFDMGKYLDLVDLGELLVDGVLLVNEQAGLSTEPDLMFCSWESLLSRRVGYRAWGQGSRRLVEVYGSPDLVVEVISRSSFRKDTVDLPERYFLAEIPEYWIIDARGGRLDFQVLVRGETEYGPADTDADGYRFSPVLQAGFRLTRDVNRVGGYRYSLLHRRSD